MLLVLILGLLGTSCYATDTPNYIFNKDLSKNWAILVAGSNGWWNYRHQADVCHAYQILKQRGIPEENIITMMYDDVAYHHENTYPGQMFNDEDMKDVYQGVQIDYRDKEVTPEMFLRVLKGDTKLLAQGKKVLKSGPEDNVFIYFSDHGADGFIAFPKGVLYATDLNKEILEMHREKRYGKMVLYIEACYSGSMFRKLLPDNINVYTTTAANHQESSYGAFCGRHVLSTCLADEYSYNWMTDSEQHDLDKWTLQDQYNSVKIQTVHSHVMQYGDSSMGVLNTAEFQTHGDHHHNPVSNGRKVAKDLVIATRAHLIGLSSRLNNAQNEKEHEKASKRLHRAMELGHILKDTVSEIIHTVESSEIPDQRTNISHLEQMECFKSVFDVFMDKCFTIQQVPEVAIYTPKFQDLCSRGYSADVLKKAVMDVCA